ncbi:MAG: ABC transporter permease [Thiotrichaceae bacterium]|nr:ABC transporter permease [Thiotrichaceae bacterium]
MNLAIAIQIAWLALRINILRSLLAMLGIIIGVASVIIMVSISTGAKQEVGRLIQGLGTNLLVISPGSSDMGGGRQSGTGTAPPFSDADTLALRQQISGVAAVSGTMRGSVTVVASGINWSTTAYGVNEEYLEVRDWGITDGRNFSAAEVRSGGKVVMLGRTVAKQLFNDNSPLGSQIRIKDIPFQVIAVLDSKGQSAMGNDNDDVLIIPVTTARKRVLGGNNTVPNSVQTIMLEVAQNESMSDVQQEVENLLRQRRNVRSGSKDDFSVRNLAEFIKARTATQNTLSVLLASTAMISLLVGGIGIMNIMLVSVTERTREIGLRIAIGARQQDIRNQFLVESVTLCLLGGFIGLLLGVLGSLGISFLGQWPIAIDFNIAFIALGSSAFVGIFFGFFPAQRAARMNPIDALRYE